MKKVIKELDRFVNVKNEAGTFELKAYDPLPATDSPNQDNKYYGGETFIEGGKNTAVAIGFPGVGVNHADYFSILVLKELLGQAGCHGRFERNLSSAPWLLRANTFNYSYAEGGLFGVFAEAKGGNGKELVDTLLKEIRGLSNVTEQEVSHAKSSAKAKLQRDRECRINFSTYNVLRVFSNSDLLTVEEELAQMDQVNASKIKSFAQKFSNSTPSLVTIGDVRGITKIQ